MDLSRAAQLALATLVCTACHSASTPAPAPAVASTHAPAPARDAGLPVPSKPPAVRIAEPAPHGPGLIGSGRAYRAILSGPVTSNGQVAHVITLRDLDSDLQLGKIDVLSTDGRTPAVTLTSGPTAVTASLHISQAAPEAVMYIDHFNPETNLGSLMYADLDRKEVKAITPPKAENVPQEGIHFGANGHQVLFVGQYDSKAAGGMLYWWGGTGEPILIGERAPFRAVLFNRDRSVAIAAIHADNATGIGDLVAVDMATGKATPIAQGVAVLALAYKAVNPELSVAPELAYSVTANGRYVACAKRDGTILLWSPGHPPVVVGHEGRFPSASEDGRSVGYFSGSDFVLWSHGREVANVAGAPGAFAPLWSPDSRFVAFLTDFHLRGNHLRYGTVVGDFSVLQVGSRKAVPWATNAGWHTARFWPPTGRTRLLSALVNLHDITKVATFDQSVGDVQVGPPDRVPDGKAVGPVRPDSFDVLQHSGDIAFLSAENPFSPDDKYTAGIWTPRHGQQDVLPAVEGSLRTGDTIVPRLPVSSHADEVLFMTDPAPTPFATFLSVGRYFAMRPGHKPVLLKDHVVNAVVANDGRVILMTQEPGSATLSDIWIVPFPQ